MRSNYGIKQLFCDLTRLPVGRPVFRGDLLVLAVAGDDKFVLFRGSTLKKRDGTESVTPTSRRAKKSLSKTVLSN